MYPKNMDELVEYLDENPFVRVKSPDENDPNKVVLDDRHFLCYRDGRIWWLKKDSTKTFTPAGNCGARMVWWFFEDHFEVTMPETTLGRPLTWVYEYLKSEE